ncbi:MAG: hypothetical protein FOGNACKC_04812 [Anaerolineae bacterium]|nr:hypothetical protein [Anaerolineae bacterium]
MTTTYASRKRTSFVTLLSILAGLLLACRPGAGLVELGLAPPAPTTDPLFHYRAILQPAARQDIEAAGPLPRYHITAQLREDKTALTGVMRVVVPAAGPELVFRLYPNLPHYAGSITVTRAAVNDAPVEIAPLADGTAIRLPTPPGGPVTVDLQFTTQLESSSGDFTLFGWAGPVLSLPGFFPMLAVQQNGQWVLDNPPLHADVQFSEAALYQLDLTLPRDLLVAGSGVTLNIIDNPDGSRTWQLSGGPLRDMTVIAGPFQTVSSSAAGATVTSYYLPGHEAAARAVLGHAAASLRLYSDTFGPYPYIKLDVVEAPLGYRGMEYAGLILIGDSLYTDQRDFLTVLVAHETAHQWWYGLVGNNPYQSPWLDEGLTEYSAFDYYRGVFGQSQAEELLTGRWNIPFQSAAAGGIDGSVDRPAVDFDPVTYELLVYSKAALFFNALRQQVGDDPYRQILQRYLAENKYRIATPQTFLTTAERVSGQNLNPLAEQWLK